LLAEVAIKRGELDAATTAARANVEALALLDRFLSSSSTPEANNSPGTETFGSKRLTPEAM
jgi:hypothetical protein